MIRTIGYKMTHDRGFAPNPFHGFLSLATCKPMIRRTRTKGDWVAGFASKKLVNDAKRQGREIQYMSLIFLMEVAQIVPIEEYFTDKNFSSKIPENESGPIRCQTCSSEADFISLVGDNIYQKNNCDLGFRQVPNIFHEDNPRIIKHDTAGKNVLIAKNFFYFGGNGFVPDGGWGKLITKPLPEARQFYCPDDFQSKLIEYFNTHEIHPGIHGLPTDWPPKCAPTTSLNQ